MALLYTDSFQYQTSDIAKNYSQTDTTYGKCTIASATPRFTGGRYMILQDGSANNYCFVRRLIPQTGPTMMVQFGYLYTVGGTFSVVTFMAGATTQCYIYLDSGFLKCYNGDASQEGDTSAIPLTMSAWHQIEVKVTFDNAAGTMLVKVDGQTHLDLSDIDTINTANVYATGVVFSNSGAAGQRAHWFSDIIIMDTNQVSGQDYCNDLLGIRQVKPCIPTADGYYKDYTPQSGSDHWAMVDEVPPVEGDYNSTPDTGDIDTFVVPDVLAGSIVNAVVCRVHGKNNAAVGSSIAGAVRSNSQDGFGTEATILGGASSGYAQSMIYVDPNTGVPFTSAGFNAAEFGYKRTV